MRQRAAASLLYQSIYAETAFRNLLKLIFLKIVGRILAFYNDVPTEETEWSASITHNMSRMAKQVPICVQYRNKE